MNAERPYAHKEVFVAMSCGFALNKVNVIHRNIDPILRQGRAFHVANTILTIKCCKVSTVR